MPYAGTRSYRSHAVTPLPVAVCHACLGTNVTHTDPITGYYYCARDWEIVENGRRARESARKVTPMKSARWSAEESLTHEPKQWPAVVGQYLPSGVAHWVRWNSGHKKVTWHRADDDVAFGRSGHTFCGLKTPEHAIDMNGVVPDDKVCKSCRKSQKAKE